MLGKHRPLLTTQPPPSILQWVGTHPSPQGELSPPVKRNTQQSTANTNNMSYTLLNPIIEASSKCSCQLRGHQLQITHTNNMHAGNAHAINMHAITCMQISLVQILCIRVTCMQITCMQITCTQSINMHANNTHATNAHADI